MKYTLLFIALLTGCASAPTAPVPMKAHAPLTMSLIGSRPAKPVITGQPQASTIKQTAPTVDLVVGGYLYIFMSATSATPITYKWFHNGVALPGNIPTVWIPVAKLSDGGTYSVQVNNSGGSLRSAQVRVIKPVKLPPPPPPPVQSATWLGGCASCDESDAGIAVEETLLGRPVDYALAWGWADTKNNFEYSAQWIKENHGSHKLVWSMPLIIHGTTFADCYNGTYDSSYTAIAQTILTVNPEAVIRTGHEMNGNWYDWSMDGPAGTAAEYAQCFAHVASLYRAVSPKFKMDWNPGAGMWAGMDSVRAYPGDEFVDIIGLDQYEDSQWTKGTPDERWNQFLDNAGRGLNFWADFAKTHGKTLAFDEWASNYDDGEYITRMASWMKANGNVHHQMYWDSESAFSGGFGTHPVNGAAFKKAFNP